MFAIDIHWVTLLPKLTCMGYPVALPRTILIIVATPGFVLIAEIYPIMHPTRFVLYILVYCIIIRGIFRNVYVGSFENPSEPR